MQLVTPSRMQRLDAYAIEDLGLPGAVLMERAALGATDHLLEALAPRDGSRIGCLCGGGNNGGDGIAMARMLHQRGHDSFVCLVSDPEGIEGDAGLNLDVARRLELPIYDLSDLDGRQLRSKLASLSHASVWVDALLGTGLSGDVRGSYVDAIEFLNDQPDVFSVDIPSGVHGATGQILGTAVDAAATATFGTAKLGQALYPGRGLCGDLKVIDIGIPDEAHRQQQLDTREVERATWLDARWSRQRFHRRPDVYHKGRAGRVLAVAGSRDKTGAALLLARGALRSGAGLLTIGTREEVVSRIAPSINEAMAADVIGDLARLESLLEESDVVACGPGLEQAEDSRRAVETVLGSDIDMAVLDADALNLVAGPVGLSALDTFSAGSTVVLTPHPGEMARLCSATIEEVTSSPIDTSLELARQTDCIVVLKSAASTVVSPDGRVAVNRSGNPGMATGGTGDVLTGCIAARLAESSTGDPFEDVCVAVWAHGDAGDRAADAMGQRGMAASDLADRLADTFKELEVTD
jgi:NAD(P)H-hydrate epimerase